MTATVTTIERGDHVLIEWDVWDGDERDFDSLDGWVMSISDHQILIACTPDFDLLDEADYSTASFPLDRVTVREVP